MELERIAIDDLIYKAEIVTQMNIFMKQKQTYRYRKQICGCQTERGWGGKD